LYCFQWLFRSLKIVRFAHISSLRSTTKSHSHQSLPHWHEIYSFSGHFPANKCSYPGHFFYAWTTKLYLKFSLQVGHSTNSNIRSQVPFTLAKHLILLSCKSNKIIKFGLARCTLWIVTAQLHGYHSNMASGSVTIPTWRRAWTLSFRPTNYEQCLQLSEWVTHLHIGVPTTNTFLHLAYPRV